MCSPSWTPSHLPPHPIPLGHSSAPGLSTLSHASNLHWRSVSHMTRYMFQCYSLKSSHPRLLPQSSKDCSIHLCLFCCLAYRVIIQFSSVAQSCPTLCNPMNCSMPTSLSITNTRSSLRLTSIESVMLSSSLILCRPLLFLPPIPPIRVFSNESTLHIETIPFVK